MSTLVQKCDAKRTPSCRNPRARELQDNEARGTQSVNPRAEIRRKACTVEQKSVREAAPRHQSVDRSSEIQPKVQNCMQEPAPKQQYDNRRAEMLRKMRTVQQKTLPVSGIALIGARPRSLELPVKGGSTKENPGEGLTGNGEPCRSQIRA